MEYGPAPESAGAGARLARRSTTRRFGHVHRRRVDRAGRRARSTTINPATGKPLAAGRARPAPPTSTPRSRPRARRCRAGRRCRGHERARYLYALARHAAEARAPARGARDARQRQADPRDAATSTCRWSPATSTTTPAGRSCMDERVRRLRAGRRRRPDHPVELSAADAGLEDRAGARRRQHRRAQAGRVHAADRAAVRRDLRSEAGAAAGRGQHRHRRRRDRRGASSTIPASTRSPSPARPRSAGIIRKATAGSGKKLSLELGGKSPFIVFDDADLDSAVEGVVDAIWFNQGQVCCAGSRLLVQEGVADALHRQAARAHGDAARRRPARQGDRHRRDRRAGAARAHQRPGRRRARAEGATMLAAGVGAARPTAASIPPTLFTGRRAGHDLAQVEIFGPVLVAMTLPHARARRWRWPTTRRYGLAASVWSENINLALDIAPQDQGRRGLGQLRPTCSTPPAASAATARAASAARAGARACTSISSRAGRRRGEAARSDAGRAGTATAPAELPDGAPSIDRTAKLYHRRQAGAAGRRLQRAGATRRAAARSARSATATARTSATRSRRRARPRGWAAATGHNRAQILYYIAENLAARADEFAERIAALTGAAPRRRAPEVEASHRAAVRLRRLGRQVRRRASTSRRSRGVALAHARADRRDRHRLPGRARRCSASSRWWRRRSPWATRVVAVPSERASAGRDRLLPGARNLRRAGRRGQHRHRRPRRAGQGAGRARRRRRALVLRHAPRARRTVEHASRRQHEAHLGRQLECRDW